MNVVYATKKSLDEWKLELYDIAVQIQHDYNASHDLMNKHLEYKKRGWVGFRVRKRETENGVSVSIEWYYLVYMDNKCYSKNIKRGKNGGALASAIKRNAYPWEYDLAMDTIEQLRPVETALNDVASMLRIYRHAVKQLPEDSYSWVHDLIDDYYTEPEDDY